MILPYGPDVKDLKNTGIDVCVLAGDVGTFKQHMDYADEIVRYLDCDVVSVLGNHEWYGKKFEQKTIDTRPPKNPRHHLLNRSEVELYRVRFLGATLWTDFACTGNQDYVMRVVAPQTLADFRFIEGMTPEVMLAEHWKDRDWLFDNLNENYQFYAKTVVVTHNSPHSYMRNPNYPVDARSACFVSDCTDLLDAAANGAENWIYGHDHWSQDNLALEYATNIRSAQYGYPGENTNWQGVQVFEV